MSTATIVESIQEIVRPLAAATPAPRALPFLGLDHPSGLSLRPLDRLAARGIFRKYELVLDLGTRLGAVSRWVAGRLGGDAVAATPSAADALAAALLTRRSQVRRQVRCVGVAAEALPFAAARFTHVWAIEPPAAFIAPAALQEAWRVVRPGGWLALQVVLAADATSDTLVAAVADAGFFEIAVDDATADAVERAPQLLAARAQLERRLLDAGGTAAAWVTDGRRVRDRLAGGIARLLQVVARRPA